MKASKAGQRKEGTREAGKLLTTRMNKYVWKEGRKLWNERRNECRTHSNASMDGNDKTF